MLIDSLLLLFMLIFSGTIFFIHNLYIIIGIFILEILLLLVFKVKIRVYLSFLIILIINFIMNYFLSSLSSAIVITLRLIIMFIMVNLIIKKIGIYHLAELFGKIFRSKEVFLIVSISLNFVPIMIKEIREIKNTLKVRGFDINLKNIVTRGSVIVVTFFTNFLKGVNDMEKVLISRGLSENDV